MGRHLVQALASTFIVGACLALWCTLHAVLAADAYRESPGRALHLMGISLLWYTGLSGAVLLPISLLVRVASGSVGAGALGELTRDRRSLAAVHAGLAAGVGALLYGAGVLAARGPGSFPGTVSSGLDLVWVLAAAPAVGWAAGRILAAGFRSLQLAARLRAGVGLLLGLQVALLFWTLIRERLGIEARSAAGVLTGLLALAVGLLAGLLAGWIMRVAARRRKGVMAAVPILVAAGLIFAVAGVTPEGPGGGGDAARPNVLLLVADTLRADHLGVYGALRTRTPNIDGLAERGVRFQRASAPASNSCPATASVLTGLYPSSHGLLTCRRDALRPEALSLARILSEAGYVTAGFAANPDLTRERGFGRGFDLWVGGIPLDAIEPHRHSPLAFTLEALGLWSRPKIFPRAGEVVRRGLDWLSGMEEDPFFLYLHFMDPHDPYSPTSPFDALYGWKPGEDMKMSFETLPEIMAGQEPVGPGELSSLLSLYDGAITSMDDQVGRLLAALEERGLLENTLVVFVADHGEEFIDHGGLGHEHTLYQELIHVPMILAGPGVRAGTIITEPVSLVDLAPTLLEGLGLAFPAPVEGLSLWGAVGRAEPAPVRDIFMEETYVGLRSPVHAFRAVRDGDAKLIGRTFQASGEGRWSWELYDLAEDPGETRNLAVAMPERVIDLRRRLESWAGRPRASRNREVERLASRVAE
jgi:arylsulfatase